jgi:protocatechuate 3,4-dioxygenase, alpha subunit
VTAPDDDRSPPGARERPRPRYDVYLGQTPAQTLGPFFHQGLLRTRSVFQVPGLCRDEHDVFNGELAAPGAFGEPIIIEGNVYDGLSLPIGDALLEAWQANGHGRYHHALDPSGKDIDPRFRGFGRVATDARGAYAFFSIKPGAVLGPQGRLQAPHVNLVLGARGMTRHAFTRVYFEADAALADDPVLSLVPEPRRQTLVARRSSSRDGAAVYRFDLFLQGERETVFFEL